MATFARRKLPGLVNDIIKHGSQYNFFQAIRLLEDSWLAHGLFANIVNKNLQLISVSEISFPAADIKECTIDEHNKLKLKLTFMGLCGVDSPLSHYFLEYAQRNNEYAECISDFLNIFNNRLYTFLYLVWKKYRPFAHIENSPYLEYLKFLSGNSLTAQDGNEFAFVGLLGPPTHSAVALTGIISEYLNDVPVSVQQFVPCLINLKSVLQIGINKICLGDNAILGSQVVTKTRKIIIQIGPLKNQCHAQLFPGQIENCRLKNLISRYLGPTLQFDLFLIVNIARTHCIKLGADDIKLGWMSWLGKCAHKNYRMRI
jgi:type VI secretion system protein ImpH